MILFWYDGFAPRLSAKYPTKREEYLRLPLPCLSGPVYVLSMLWLGWSARPEVHWFVPLASMVPYSLSYHIIYVAIINVCASPSHHLFTPPLFLQSTATVHAVPLDMG